MSKLTKKQRIAHEEAYARDMREIHAQDVRDEEAKIVAEIAAEDVDHRTRGGFFEDAYGGPIVCSDEVTRDLAYRRGYR